MDSVEPSLMGFPLHVWGSFDQFLAMNLWDYIGPKQDTDSCMPWLDNTAAPEPAPAVLGVFCSSVVKKQRCGGLAEQQQEAA